MSAAEASPLLTLASSNVITPDDHGAYVTITASLMFVSMVLLTGLRLAIRYPFRQLFGLDDAAIVISALCATAQTVVVLQAVKFGLGKHVYNLTDDQRDITQKLSYVGNVLFVVSLSFSKTATSLLMSRLTRARNQVVAAYVTSVIITIWGVAFTFAVAINCKAARPWDMQVDRCSNWQEIWTAFGAIGLFFEVILATLPACLLWSLQMSASCKATVAFGFCFRLIVIPLEAFRLHYLVRTLSSTDPTFDVVPFVLFTSVEQHYSLIAATIPCLRPFLKAAHTGLLDVNPTQVDQCGSALTSGGGSGAGRRDGAATSASSYAMRSIDRASSARPPSKLSDSSPKSAGGKRFMEVATGFAAFDASTGGVMEIPQTRKGSLATVATTATGAACGSETMRSLDTITLAEPLSASPTVARHMVLSPGYAPPGAAAALPLVTAQAIAVPEKERERVEERAQQGGGDDDSFESDGSERLIIRKETDLSVRYSPVAMRKEAAVNSGSGVPMGFDLERIEEGGEWRSGSFESGRNDADAERWRGASLEIGRARGGESLDVRRETDMGRIPIGLSVERGRRVSADSGNGRLGSWFETETPKERGSWESVREDRQVEKRYKGNWREQRERHWGRR